MSQYRGGSSVTRAIGDPSTSGLLSHGSRGMSLGLGSPFTLESRAVYPRQPGNSYTDSEGPSNGNLERKLDQMMGMITDTQQFLVEQQSNHVIVGEKIEQISADVQILQREMKEIQGFPRYPDWQKKR